MQFKKGDFVRIFDTSNNFRYGYISEIKAGLNSIVICLDNEGDSKIEYDCAQGATLQWVDWNTFFTDAERKIIPLLAEGMSTNDIANELNVAPVTIRSQIRTIRIKLHLENKNQLTAYCSGIMNWREKNATR